MRKIAVILLLLSSLAVAQNRQEYSASEFTGGLVLATDTIDMNPNEAIQMDNMTLNKFGALHKRYGIINWNDSLVSADTIKDIHYVEDKNGDKMQFIATNKYVYEAKSWEDVDSMATWDSLVVGGGAIVDYTRGQIDTAISGQRYIYGDTTSWIIAALPNDRIIIGDSIYIIDSVLTDTTLYVTTAVGTHGGEPYRLLKCSRGNPSLSSYNGNLYVADDLNEPWWYNGTQPFNLGIVDSGIVDSIQPLSEPTLYRGQDSTAFISRTSRDFPLWFNTFNVSLDSIQPTDNLHLSFRDGDFIYHDFKAEIMEENASNSTFRVNLYPGAGQYWRPPVDDAEVPLAFYHIRHPDLGDNSWAMFWIYEGDTWADSRAPARIIDSSKTWGYDDYQGFFLMNGNNARKGSPILANDPTNISYDSLDGSFDFAKGDQYYIVWQAPHMINKIVNFDWYWYNLDSVFVNETFFSQIYFHRNRLYAIGKEISRHTVEYDQWNVYTEGDTLSTGRVWFSGLGIPGYIPSDFNFDIYGANPKNENISVFSSDATRRFFVLRDDLYLTTKSNIYRISGNIVQGPEDLWISQVIHGVGTNQPNGIVTTKDNVAYVMNQQGIWWFDGNAIEKISYNVDPFIETNRNSRMTAGKFKDDLIFSYPDSNKTMILFYPLKKFVGPWNIGMLTINDQFVAIDSNYVLFAQSEDSAYVLKYPRDFVNFSDILEPNDTSVVVFRYRPGWMTFGTLQHKILEDIEITAFTINPVSGYDFLNYLAVYRDFTDTVRWSATAFSEGTPINAFESIGDIQGRAFQILVKDSTDNDFWLSNWLARWYER